MTDLGFVRPVCMNPACGRLSTVPLYLYGVRVGDACDQCGSVILAFSIVEKIIAAARDDGYLDLEHTHVCIDLWVHVTADELAFLRRLTDPSHDGTTPDST